MGHVSTVVILSTVHCRQPIRCGDDGFSIQILIRISFAEYNLLWSVDRQLWTFFFVNGPLSTVDSWDVVLYKFASKYGYGLFT
jgi:hypothetical protein